jgi:hypothetical protein
MHLKTHFSTTFFRAFKFREAIVGRNKQSTKRMKKECAKYVTG